MSNKPRPTNSRHAATTKTTTKRLLQELSTASTDILRNPSIECLHPTNDDDLTSWTSTINGRHLANGYSDGRWQLSITAPSTYPLAPPTVRFKTKICASNVDFHSGEVCLDLLKDKWSPAYTIASVVDAVVQMLEWPGVDSPLNVELARLLRDGDAVAAEALVRYWSAEERYDGP